MKQLKSDVAPELIQTYSVARKDSGYLIIQHKIENGKVVSSTKVSEPDVLQICMATLQRFIRKDVGL